MGTIQRRNTSESLLDGIRENIQVANLPSAEDGFHLRPHFFNRVEIRAVGRKIQPFYTLFCPNFPDCLYTMGAHIVHYYDIARTKSREQNLFQILDKAFSRRPALVSCERFLPIQTNGRENRCCSRRVQRCVIHCCPHTRFAGQKNILYNGKERGNKHDSKSTKTHSTAALR